MTQGNDDAANRFLPRIREELDKLPLTDEEKDQFIGPLLKNAAYLDTQGGTSESGKLQTDSPTFAFAERIQAVVDHFKDHGMTFSDYLKAIVRRPDVLTVSSGKIVANIEGVISLFEADGLTTEEYLRAAIKQPSLFVQSPETLAGNIIGLVEQFSEDGLTDRVYLNAALKAPSLFTLSPARAESNIREVVQRYEADGMTRSGYLKAALQLPALFALSPETVARHIDIVQDFAERGIFDPPRLSPHAISPAEPPHNSLRNSVIRFLLKNPRFMTLADENFGLREVHQSLTDGPTDYKLLHRPRHAVERELMRHLGHDNPRTPVPNDGFVAGQDNPTEEQAKRFVLRALMHAGLIKGGSMER